MFIFFVRLLSITMFVGVSFSTAIASNQAIVAKRTIYPGQEILAVDLKAVELIKVPKIRYRFVTSTEEIVGLVAKRTILRGHFIATTSAEPAAAIRAGDKIRVRFQSGGLAIEIVGVAMTEGRLGDEISLRNPQSGKVFPGRIRMDGVVIAGQL